MRISLSILALALLSRATFAQEMPVIPPPGSPPAQAPLQVLPPGTPSMEQLAGQGFEVRAVERVSERGNGFMVLMQRGAEIRACLMRVERGTNGQFQRQSGCF